MTRNDLIVEKLQKGWPGLQAVYLFGSVAKGEARPGSDLDIAALGQSVKGVAFNLGLELSRDLGVDVDLIDLAHAPTVLQKEVIEHGHLLWTSNPLETEFFALRVWSSYQKLCEERREIVEEGLATARFYRI